MTNCGNCFNPVRDTGDARTGDAGISPTFGVAPANMLEGPVGDLLPEGFDVRAILIQAVIIAIVVRMLG